MVFPVYPILLPRKSILRPVVRLGETWLGLALANNLGPLNGQVINFLEDAAQGTAIYGASLVGQPAHQPFQG